MNRRSMVLSAGAFLCIQRLKARSQCAPNRMYGQVCQVGLDLSQIAMSVQKQQCPEWCWAASIAMIFTFLGHPIDQKQIVAQTWGAVACLPAMNDLQIAQALSRRYVDANGASFRASITAAFDPQVGISTINNSTIVNELQSNRPLLVCNTHHAMVLSAAGYLPRPYGIPPSILAIGVVDPWPYSPTLHNLPAPEMVPVGMWAAPGIPGQLQFLAAVRIV